VKDRFSFPHRRGKGFSRYLLVVAILAPAIALPHTLAYPKLDTVHVAKDRVTVTADYSLDVAASADLKRVYDRNRDGVVAGDERATLEGYLRIVATHYLSLTLDGNPLRLSETGVSFEGLDEPIATGKELRAIFELEAALGSGGTLTLSDRHKDRAIEIPVSVDFADDRAPIRATLGASARSLAIPRLPPVR
jgi:hypothetical protein